MRDGQRRRWRRHPTPGHDRRRCRPPGSNGVCTVAEKRAATAAVGVVTVATFATAAVAAVVPLLLTGRRLLVLVLLLLVVAWQRTLVSLRSLP